MLRFRLGKSVKRIVIPQHIAAAIASPGATGSVPRLSGGSVNGVYVLKHKKKRKKLSKGTRVFEKLTRQVAKANIRGSDEYLYRHRRSNRKRRNGWLRDLSENLMRGNRKGRKRLKLSKLF